jgi:hypothetical protein
VTLSDRTFHVKGYEKIEYDLRYVDGVFVSRAGFATGWTAAPSLMW